VIVSLVTVRQRMRRHYWSDSVLNGVRSVNLVPVSWAEWLWFVCESVLELDCSVYYWTH